MSKRILVPGPDRLSDYLRPYCDALREVGAEPIRAWPSDGADVESFLTAFDGLLLPGGSDVEPACYGESPHERLGEVDSELDEIQIALAKTALAERFPTLAICRGIQVLAVAAGATLYQDLPTQRPSEVTHRIREPRDHLAHSVDVDPDSRLAGIVESRSFLVNSRHHQAVRETRPGWVGSLRVVSRAPDGVVEAIEQEDNERLLAVQWHPENLVASQKESRGLFAELVTRS